jgi:beta-fructofuranosidase
MQYFKPEGPFFVGDCMPFHHDGVFHLFYLLDEDHHQGRGGLGGHQWAHASTTDLVHWQHHPLAIGITDEWEGSICTGSVFHHGGTYHAYYATRMPDRTQHLSLATSKDGITFSKVQANPFASPGEGYDPRHYRDPFVFRDEGVPEFHMLVTASLSGYPLHGRGGCLVRLVSEDLRNWKVAGPFIVPGGRPGHPSIPECPDYFRWNGWFYLIFGLDGMAHYRMSRHPMGPWTRPRVDTFDGPLAAVMKTAAFGEHRRIGVCFLNSREGDRDDGKRLYAGNAVFREIIQHPDGTLGSKFPPEMVPASGAALHLPLSSLTESVSGDGRSARLEAWEGLEAAFMEGVPVNARITVAVRPEANSADYGLCLRGSGGLETGYELHLLPYEQRVTLNAQSIPCVEGLDRPLALEIILQDDIVDVCVDGRRCLIDRCPELQGDRLFFLCRDGRVAFDSIEVRPLT